MEGAVWQNIKGLTLQIEELTFCLKNETPNDCEKCTVENSRNF
jgi:hypothetical protein